MRIKGRGGSYRLAVMSSHPVQYHVGIWRALHRISTIESTVLYEDTIGLSPVHVPEFNAVIAWDMPLLDGYSYRFLKNLSWHPLEGFFSRVNPGIFIELMIKKYDAVLIHGYSRLSDWFSLCSAIATHTRIIFKGEATLGSDDRSFGIKRLLKKIVLQALFKVCDAVMYSCSGNKAFFIAYGTPENKLFPIPCAVDNDYFQKAKQTWAPQREQIRSELGIPADDLVILFVARITENKRPLDLARAAERLAAPNITLLYVGDGPERGTVERYCREKKIKAVFVGFKNQSEIGRFYAIGDLYVLISGFDKSPKAMNEAMNFDLPVICTDAAGTARDLVQDGVNGFLVKTGDIGALTEKIAFFNDNRTRAKAMGKTSGELIRQWNFSVDALNIERAVAYVMNRT